MSVILGAYHLNGIFGYNFPTNGTGFFLLKEGNGNKLYHSIFLPMYARIALISHAKRVASAIGDSY